MRNPVSPPDAPPGYRHTPGLSAFVDHVGPLFHKTVTRDDGAVEHWGGAAEIVALAAPESHLWDRSDLGLVEVAMRRALGMTIYGGTSEIQRSLIAECLLKMPKSRS